MATCRASSSAVCARASVRDRTRSHKSFKRNAALRLRAVVDSENEASSAAGKNAPSRPAELQLRPAGVSDAVVDSQKALEALARLGGNRTFSARAFRRVFMSEFASVEAWAREVGRSRKIREFFGLSLHASFWLSRVRPRGDLRVYMAAILELDD